MQFIWETLEPTLGRGRYDDCFMFCIVVGRRFNAGLSAAAAAVPAGRFFNVYEGQAISRGRKMKNLEIAIEFY